jgi:O-antigen/teichoic acid export membrane protein
MKDSPFRTFAKSVAVSASVQILLKMKGLILMPILTKTLGVVNYGVWAQVSVICSLVSPLAMMGLPNGLFRYLPGRDGSSVQREYYSVTFIVFLSTLSWCLLIWLLAEKISVSFLDNANNAVFVRLAGVSVVLSALQYVFMSYFRLFAKAKTYSALTLLEAFAAPVLIGLAVYSGYGLLGAVVTGISCSLCMVLVTAAIVLKSQGIARPDFVGMRKYFTYGLPLIPTGWFLWVTNSSDRLFISHYCGVKDLGVYSLVYSLGQFLVGFIFDAIFLFFSPMVVRLWNEGKTDKAREMIEYTIKYGLMLAIPAVFGFCALGKPLLLLLATEDFAQGVVVIPFVGLGYVFFMLSAFYEVVIGLIEKTKIVPIVFGSCAALNLLLNVLLIPRLGMVGAALATALSFGAQMAAYATYARRFFTFHLGVTFIVKSVLASALMASLIHYFILPTSVVEVLAAALFSAALYFAALWAMGSFSLRERLFFRGLILGTFRKPVASGT